MRTRLVALALSLLCAAVVSEGCRAPSQSPARQRVAVLRPAGTWQGTGSKTIGFVSDSGRFHIRWETHDESPPKGGTFRLAVHSAVSGRPIQLVADQRGEGSGSFEFADDPRPYNFMVDSANVQWSFTVDEIVAGEANPPESPPTRDR